MAGSRSTAPLNRSKSVFIVGRLSAFGAKAECLGGFGFFEGFGQGGHDFEDVGDYAVVGDFEDGGVGVFVDGDDGAGAFHADDVLDGAADTEREIEFWGDSLAGAADLALHGEPAFVADGTRGRDFSAEGFGEGFGLGDVFGGFDAAADGDDDGGLREVDGGFGFLEKIEGLGADLLGFEIDGDFIYWSLAAGMRGEEIGAEGAGLEGGKPRGGALEGDIGGGFALEHLADEDEFAGFVAVADAVADHAFAERSCEFGSEIADLISVREKDEIGFGGVDDLLESDAVAVGRVGFEEVVFDLEDFGDVFCGEFDGECVEGFADDEGADCAGSVFRDLLGGGKCFKAGVVPLALSQFGDDEDFHRTSFFILP